MNSLCARWRMSLRLSRRELATHLQSRTIAKRARQEIRTVVISGDRPTRAYVFLTAPKPTDVTYERYREMRTDALFAYCHGVKLKFPDVVEAVGIASEPMTETMSSQDFIYVELSADMFDDDATAKWHETMAELDILQSPPLNLSKFRSHEFPMPFNFSKEPSSFRSVTACR